PRLHGKYPAFGTVAVLEQLGRLPGGSPGAVLRGICRARIGTGVNGPGAALWVEATPVADTGVGDRARELSGEYKQVVLSMMQRRGAWQVVDSVQRITDPGQLADTAGYASYLDDEQKVRLLETVDVAERLTLLLDWGRAQLAE